MAFNEPVLFKRIGTDNQGWRYFGYEDYVKTGGYAGLKKAMEMTPKQLVDFVKASELRGRGGAGFSAGLKWSFMPEPDGQPRYLTVNADESEPGTFKDRVIMDYDPHMLLEGIAICCKACNLDTAYIYIRGEYHRQYAMLNKALREAYQHNIFGPNSIVGDINGRKLNCYVHQGAGAYICGEETGLLESLEGKRGWPRIKPPFPAIKGAFGRPTIINNVETLACLPFILNHGIEWFKGMGRASTLGEKVPGSFGPKLFGISGHVNAPGVYEEELGVKMSTMIEKYAGGMRRGKKFKAAIPGGVSMGFVTADQYDCELDFDIGRRYGVLGLGTAGVIVMDEDTDIVAMVRNIVRFFSRESCGQCTPCREGSGWLYKVLCRIEAGEGTMKDIDLLDEVAGSMGAMPGTTICGLADGTSWAVKTAIKKFRPEFEKRCRASLVQVGIDRGQE